VTANCHGLTAAKAPWPAADAASTPIKNAPLTLMTIVPQGNVSPTRRATNPDSQNLAIPPKTLPRETQITPSIVSTACLDLLSDLHAVHQMLKRPMVVPFNVAESLSSASSLSSLVHNNQHIQPVARTVPGWRTTELLDFTLRQRRRPERHIAMA
jgi:hypothetical protein